MISADHSLVVLVSHVHRMVFPFVHKVGPSPAVKPVGDLRVELAAMEVANRKVLVSHVSLRN